ncbi:hypothetical protein [Kribbella catacumbae]|uniref:hypothetical protein n=1 Tax=Kribbella catacumbae TaxID=460086 RepID=UPI00037DF7EC|nr:hypothetical protein [Kribbella catacumbae]
MSRVRRVLVPVSVTVALLVSGLQTQAFADSAGSSAPSAAADLQGWRSQSNQPNPELNAVLPAGVASNEQVPSPVKRDGRRVKELPGRRTPTSKVFQLADGRAGSAEGEHRSGVGAG